MPRMDTLKFLGVAGFPVLRRKCGHVNVSSWEEALASQVTTAVQALTTENLADECLHFISLSVEANR